MSENDDRNKLLGLEKQAREKAAKQAQADLKERVAFHKVQKKENEEKLKAEKDASDERIKAEKDAAIEAAADKKKAEDAAAEKKIEDAKKEAKEQRVEQVADRKKAIENDKKDRELNDRSFEDRQKKQDDRLNRRLDLEEARNKEGSIRFLADQMQEGKAGAVDEANNANLAAKLRDMNAFTNIDANESSNEMSTRFNDLIKITETGTDDEKRSAQLQLNELSKAADDEEGRREKKAEAEKMAGLWGRMEQGINRSADNLEGMRNNLLKGGGIVAVLGTLALLFMDPETLFEAIKSGLEIVRNIIQGIKDFISGDMETRLQMVKDNLGPIALALTGLAIIFLPSILRGFVKIGNIASGIGKFLGIMRKGFLVLRGLIMGAATANAVAGGGVLAMFSAALIPLAPVIAIGLAIAAAIGVFGFLMTKLRDAMGLGSVMDLIFIAWGYVKDGFAHVGNVFIRIANVIMGFIEKVAKWFGFEIEMPQMEEMKTNNAETAKTEARLRKIKKDEEKAAEEQKKLQEEAEQEAAMEGADLTVDIEVQGPSDDELKKQEEVDKFRAMMGFKKIEREKLINNISSDKVVGIEGKQTADGQEMISSSAANAKAQADAAGRPDVDDKAKGAINMAMGGSSSSMTTFNTLAPNSSRISRLNFLNQ